MATKQDKPEPFVIRKAEPEDLPVLVDFLARLALHVAGSPPQDLKKKERKRLTEELADSLADHNKLLVVAEVRDHGLVGMGYLFVSRGQSIWEQAGEVEFKSGIIDDVWVEPDFRNRGIFSAILRKLVAFAESRGVQELILEYAASNQEAEATWTRLGFRTTGVRAAAFTKTVRNVLAKSG